MKTVSDGAWDGEGLLTALQHAAATLNAQLDEVNALNVFPVPDGDTGTNMLATVQAAIAEAQSIPETERSVARIGAALSLGALMGARGNSGVILSQVFRGLGEAVADAPQIGGRELVGALEQGCSAAFAAVAEPVEGTMLTVVRDASRAAADAADGNGALEHVLSAAVAEAAASVERTPSLLPVLRRAGVVDAGGRGIELLLRGALASLHAEPVPTQARLPHDVALPDFDHLEIHEYGYETVFLVQPRPWERLDAAVIRERLAQLGESVLVAGDRNAVKIHVHNERPDEILAYGLSLGTLSRISVENLDRQASAVREHAVSAAATEALPIAGAPTSRPTGPAVVAVAPGTGLARVFDTLGATAVVRGGQSANPSAGQLAEAFRATGAGEVIVLPNNPNVRLAAIQAGELVPDIQIEVVRTRNPAEGVAALLVFDPDLPLREAAKMMAAAGSAIQTLQVTAAVRDARIGRRKVRRGEYIALGAGERMLAADRDRSQAVVAGIRRLKPGFELLTVYRGNEVDHAAAEELRGVLCAEMEGVEVELVDGGQPHYDFLISAE